jgi:8-oxo-dGTP diphosphatase
MNLISPIEVVSAFIINKNGKILLLKRSENNKTRKDIWQFPEGKTNIGEPPGRAIRRELLEEIGNGKILKKLGEFPFIYYLFGIPIKSKRHLFEVSIPRKIKLSKEHSEYGWFSKKEVLKLKLVPGVGDIINQYLA